ncbi:hypothetical protein DY000_02052659 [Brassica cretica]|uniref:Uncharacterized protein n=1 Tax=Brassica cretica TaxID=69181 RepID=A0ABQ7AHG9_BRACR|nr:hypothetical protein DY000_02052659 [Brassica cretica]
MILRDEWKRARQERAVFEQVASLRTKVEEIEANRDRDICKGSRAARREKKEVSAEIQLHEVVANLDLLSEIKEHGLVVEDEIVRLKEMEEDCKAAANLAAAPNWSVADLDLPQVSKDSIIVDEAVNSSVREEASS